MNLVSLLERGSANELRKFAAAVFPKNKQPKNDEEAEVLLHYARVHTKKVKTSARLYSVKWLTDHGYDPGVGTRSGEVAFDVQPRKIVEAVGMAVIPRSPEKREIAAEKQAAMARVATEMMLDDRPDVHQIKREMKAAAARIKEL